MVFVYLFIVLLQAICLTGKLNNKIKMRIGLYDVDSKMPNLALMKLAAYHKSLGDNVEFYCPIFKNTYDKIYASKIFTYSDKSNIFDDMIIGGSGWDLSVKLSDEMEHIMPDYKLYNMNYSLGYTTRGCFRNCEFCLVPKKEGKLKYNTDIYEFWGGHKNIILLDNNIFGLKGHFEKIAEQILKEDLRVDFNQGLDIRLLTDNKAKILKKLKPLKQWRFAFDSLKYENKFRKGAEIIIKNKISKSLICVYVLAGFDESFEDTLKRINIIYKEYGFDPFVMVYRDKKGNYNHKFKVLKKWGRDFKDLARYVNHKAIFKSIDYKDYIQCSR